MARAIFGSRAARPKEKSAGFKRCGIRASYWAFAEGERVAKKKDQFQSPREFVVTMIKTLSQSTMKQFPTRLVLQVAEISSASWYAKRRGAEEKQKPGPKPVISDETLLQELREELANSKFHSEGYKKVHKRLRRKDVICGGNRVHNLLAQNNLLAPQRNKHVGGGRKHDGPIIQKLPNQMWGTDGKRFYTQQDGWCWLFDLIDHCNDELLGWHAVKHGDRFAAMEPVREAVVNRYGSIERNICKDTGLFLRSDHGSQYMSEDFRNELKFLGLCYSPAFVRSPECNGVIERFHRTIKEQVFDVYVFETLEEARIVIKQFIDEYNNNWLIHRLNLKSPVQFRQDLEKQDVLKTA